MSDRERARRRMAPLLLGSLVGSLVAAHGRIAILFLAVSSVAAAAAGAPRPTSVLWRTLLGGVIVAALLNAYLIPGHPLPWPRVFGAVATFEGLRQGLLLGLRLTGAAIAVHGLRAAWPGERAVDELASRLRWLEALRVPVRRPRAMIGLALRFAPLMGDEVKRIAAIQELRAGRPPRGWSERLQRTRAVAMPALVGALERADQVALALEARHYRMREVTRMPAAGWGWRGAGWALAGAGLLWR